MHARDVLSRCPIMPVIALEKIEQAVPLAEALFEAGVNTMEITLRTDAALACIDAVAKAMPEMLVGAGTVLSSADLAAAIDSGAQYIITPGITDSLLEEGTQIAVPMIPGVSNASTIMQAMAYGYDCLKFFPAEVNGGVAALKSYQGPFSQAQFCPTGGINATNMGKYLALNNVLCIGGSWIVENKSLEDSDYQAISALTRQAMQVAKSPA